MVTLAADLEGDGLLDTIEKIWVCSIADVEDRVVTAYYEGGPAGGLEVAIARLKAADRTIWHHGLGYDLLAIKAVLGETLDWTKVIDTLVLSKLDNPVRTGIKAHSLASWGHRVGVHKLPDLDWKVWSPGLIDRCNSDVTITLRVWDALKHMLDTQPTAVALEHGCAWETAQIVHRGMALDVECAQNLLSEFLEENEQCTAALKKLFPPIFVSPQPGKPVKELKIINKNHPLRGMLDPGVEFCPVELQEFNPGSRQQVAERLITKYGWRPTEFTDMGSPKINADVLEDLPYPEAAPLKEYFTVDKKIGQLNSPIKKDGSGGGWLHHVRPSGRVHAGLNPIGAITRRPSCSSPNVQQVNKKDLRMRQCWVATPGWRMVGVDAAGLELRGLAHYMVPYDNGAYMETLLEGDIHTEVQHLWGFYSRDQVKRGEYGWLYGAGDLKLGLIFMQDAALAGKPANFGPLGIPPTKDLAVIGARMRKTLQDRIQGVSSLIADVKARSKQGWLKALDGGILQVRSEHAALNLLIQSAGILIVKKAMVLVPAALEAAGMRICVPDYGPKKRWAGRDDFDVACVMWVHDELQFEVRPGLEDQVGQIVSDCITQAAIDLGFRCPIHGTFKAGDNWAETH
jgi:DNA polymerase-1